MNTPLPPHTRCPLEPPAQGELPLVTQGVQRHVWQSRFGPMLIEVVDGAAYVNGERVAPAGLGSAPPASPDEGTT